MSTKTTKPGVDDGVSTTVVATEVTPLGRAGFAAGSTTATGKWKDGLCDCCSQGICHPSLWCAWCCPLLLMGQVLTRLKMTWYGTSAVAGAYRYTFWTILGIVIVYCIASSVLGCPPEPPTQDDIDQMMAYVDDDNTANDIQSSFQQMMAEYEECPDWKSYTLSCVEVIMTLYSLIVMIRLRRAVRMSYQIKAQSCCGDDGTCVEDCCCVFWCSCCTVSQMARQTADYDHIRAVCCSTTGLPTDLEVAVPPPEPFVMMEESRGDSGKLTPASVI
jgi:PLAC8 family